MKTIGFQITAEMPYGHFGWLRTINQSTESSSDSVETFTTIEGKKSTTRPDSFTEIHQTGYRINTAGCDVGFIGVPAHVDVERN